MPETDLDSLVVRLEADTKSFRSDIMTSQKRMATSTDKMSKSVTAFSKRSKSAFDFFKKSASTALGFVGGQVILAGFSKLKNVIAGTFTDGIAAASKQEDSIQRLNSALAQSGQFSVEASRAQQEFASALQQTTKFGDEAILEAQSLLQSLGRLDQEGLQGATTASLDLAAALGIDLKAAVTLVGKAATGEISSFSRYGVIIKKGSDNAETFENTLKALNTQFGGSAAAQIKTFSGITTQTSNSFGDLTEEIGFLITQNPAVISGIGELGKIFNELGAGVKDNEDAMKGLVTDGILLFVDSLPLIVDGVNVAVNSLGRLRQVAAAVMGGIASLVGATDFADAAAESFAEEERIIQERGAAFDKIKQKILSVRDAIVTGAKDSGKAQEELNEQLLKQSENVRLLEESVVSLSATDKARLDAAIDRGSKALEAEEEFNTNFLELLQERMELEQETLDNQLANQLISKEDFEAQKTQIEKQGSSERVGLARDAAKKKFQIEQQSAAALSGIAGNLATTFKAFGKSGFAAYKAFAKAQALIDTYRGAAAAYQSVVGIPFIGPTLAPIAAAAAVGAGLSRVALINKQNPAGFIQGGEIPGRGRGDTVPIMAEPGENVIDRTLSRQLKERFAGRGVANEGGGSMTIKFIHEIQDNFIEVIETQLLERERLNIRIEGTA